MIYKDFECAMSQPRMSRYLRACQGDTRKSMTLYRLNLKLSQELFTLISCFEISLRNAIDCHYSFVYGADWLRNSIGEGGFYNNRQCYKTASMILDGMNRMTQYSSPKLIAEMDFGFWRYMFAKHQFYFAGQSLLSIFPSKPVSTPEVKYNNTYIFQELEKINNLRNRLAHHEPVCFLIGAPIKDTTYARQNYDLVQQLFKWMNIKNVSLLYGLDHVHAICLTIDQL